MEVKLGKVLAFSQPAVAAAPKVEAANAKQPQSVQGDPNEYGDIFVSDSKGSRFVTKGTRGQAGNMNLNLAYGLEGGAWFVFHPEAHVSEHRA